MATPGSRFPGNLKCPICREAMPSKVPGAPLKLYHVFGIPCCCAVACAAQYIVEIWQLMGAQSPFLMPCLWVWCRGLQAAGEHSRASVPSAADSPQVGTVHPSASAARVMAVFGSASQVM